MSTSLQDLVLVEDEILAKDQRARTTRRRISPSLYRTADSKQVVKRSLEPARLGQDRNHRGTRRGVLLSLLVSFQARRNVPLARRRALKLGSNDSETSLGVHRAEVVEKVARGAELLIERTYRFDQRLCRARRTRSHDILAALEIDLVQNRHAVGGIGKCLGGI